MTRAALLLSLVLALVTPAAAQPLIGPPIVTASQRAIWDREKSENHRYFQQVCSEGAKDTTTAERYGSRGRWSAQCVAMGGPADMAQRSYAVAKRISNNWTPASLGTGNELREHATEHVVTLTWIAPHLTPAEIEPYKAWLVSNAEKAITSAIRLNDADQVVGTAMFLYTMDRAFGTAYNANPLVQQMVAAIRGFIARSEGGGWVDFGDYDPGTLFILIQGAKYAGIEHFPEVAALEVQLRRAVPQWFTPDLKETLELGDDESPNAIKNHAYEDLLAILGHDSPEVRTFELELRQVRNWPDGAPVYNRYLAWANPYSASTPWRAFVGTWLHNPGLGKLYARTGWSPQDCAFLAYFPPLSSGLGGIDHVYDWFGHWRVYCDGAWRRDSPIGYSANVLLANQTILAGLPAAGEVGLFTGAQLLGSIVYGSGTNAGLNVNSGYYNPPATYRYELSPSLFYIPAWRVVVKVERIHLDDPKVQTLTPTSTTLSLTRFSAALQTAIRNAPLIRSIWHSQATTPVVENGVILGDDRVTPLYDATFTVVDLGLKTSIATAAVGNPSVITTAAPHGLKTGEGVILADVKSATGATSNVNGSRTVTVTSDTTFTVPVAVTAAGQGGYLRRNYGTLADRERKHYVAVDPVNQAPGFRVLTTVIGDATGTVEQLGDVQRVRLKKAGARDIVIISSTKPGPTLTTTRDGNLSVHDRAKADAILAARLVTVGAWADATADVYVEQPTGLVQLAPPSAPAPSPAQREIQILREALERLAPMVP